MASKSVIKEIKNFTTQILACGINLKKVILYGSYARNSQNEYSDIDIALVADEFSGVPSEDVKLFMAAMRSHYMVQPQTFNTKDFIASRDPFVAEILKTGIEIKA